MPVTTRFQQTSKRLGDGARRFPGYGKNDLQQTNKHHPNGSLWELSIHRKLSKGTFIGGGAVLLAATLGLSACAAGPYSEAGGLPNRTLTPGLTNPAVTQSNIRSTICVVGWTATVRPPVTYTNQLKYSQLNSGYNLNGDTNMKDYEEDHIVPLEVGGNPSDPRNLWPEPHNIKYGSFTKDQLENEIHRLICSGRLSLKAGQSAFLGNWESAYQKYIGRLP